MKKILPLLALLPVLCHAQFSGGISMQQAAGAAPVQSVAGRVGNVTLAPTDIAGFNAAAAAAAAAASSTSSTVQSVAGKAGAVTLVPADIVGFASSASSSAPVQTVAGKTGAVVIAATDVTGVLAAANNLSDLPAPATARTNLGLGTVATQNASAVAVTGGTINGTTVGTTTPANASVTTITHSGAEIDTTVVAYTPAAGSTVVTIAGTNLITPASGMLTLTIQLPACNASNNGLFTRYMTTTAVSSLTVNAASGSVVGAPGSLAAGAGDAFICRGSNASWYHLY